MTQQTHAELEQEICRLGAVQVATLPVSHITFHPEFRELCRANSCGMYNKCWMCPPYVGETAPLIAQARSFARAIVYQTIRPLEDSFDIEGMLEAGALHNRLALEIQALLRQRVSGRFLHLGAGGCRRCASCAKLEAQPCRFPKDALASLEAYCIDVSQLAKACGLPYLNGANTVTYFGALFLD